MEQRPARLPRRPGGRGLFRRDLIPMVTPAQRLGKIPPYLFGEIARLKAQALAEGRDLIDLGIGDPDQPTPAPIIDALCQAARDPETHRYDESKAGWPPFLRSVADWYRRRFGVTLD